MALRAWRGPVLIEGVQTGDGRVMAEGATSWADPPLPLGFLDREMHGDLVEGAVTIGTIDSLERVGNEILGTGSIDDEIPEGAEVIRRMDAGSAPGGARWGISVDPDDWEVEIIATEDDDGDVMILASGTGPLLALRAAAGEEDPGEGGGDEGTTLFEDSADAVLLRFTRLRIRGATLVALPAFDGAFIELVAAGEPAPAEEASAAAVVAAVPLRPPAAWFSMPEPAEGDTRLVAQPSGARAVPLTITDEGQVFGHIAPWETCHRGYPGQCVSAPASEAAYAHFHVGEVVCDDGSALAAGALTVGCDHAAGPLLAPEARDHYAHSGMAWADVRASNGAHGVWACGALRPSVTAEQVRVLRASSLSGDWRRVPGGRGLELCAALAVNSPGFPIAREALAAGLGVMAPAPTIHLDAGVQASLVAAGVVTRCADCAERERAVEPIEALRRRVARLEAHLAPSLLAALDERLNGPAADAVVDRIVERMRRREAAVG